MKYIVYLNTIILLYICELNLNSQEKESIPTRDRLVYGGSFGLMLGSFSQVELSPFIGYRITPPWMAGAGVIYQYYGVSRAYGGYSTSIYGTNVFSKYTIVRDFPAKGLSIFAYAGYEALNLSHKYFGNLGSDDGRFFLHSALLGGGLRQYMGGRSSVELQILFTINQVTRSPYSNPIIRIAFNF